MNRDGEERGTEYGSAYKGEGSHQAYLLYILRKQRGRLASNIGAKPSTSLA